MKYFKITLFLLFCAIEATPYEAKDFSYLVERMPGFDKKSIEIHLQLYQGYVSNVNTLNSKLNSSSGDPIAIQAIKKQFGWEYDGMILHQLYFENLGGDGKLSLKSPLYKMIENQFASFAKWKEEVMTISMTRGAGWVVLYWNPERGELINAWIEDHARGPLISCVPLLVIDLWEHAYLCQFGLNRKEYMDTVFKYLNWDVIHQRMSKDRKAPLLRS